MSDRSPGADVSLDAAEGISAEPVTQWDLFRTRLARHKQARIAAIFLSLLFAIVFAAPFVTCAERDAYCGKLLEHPATQLRDPQTGLLLVQSPPSTSRPFGTDDIGRDVLSRVIHGGRASLTVGLMTGLIVATVGTVVGALAGYYPGAVDQVLMRVVDVILGLPLLPVAIVFGSLVPQIPVLPAFLKEGAWVIAFLLGILLWGGLARIVRAEFLSLREKEFVEAARAAGSNDRRIIFRHILPNAMSPIIVATTLVVGTAIIIEAALSFLGFGVRPPTPTWGGMSAAGARVATKGFWWEFLASSSALVATVLAVNFMGDGLRDALDPTQTIERK